jgi:hypothetical protein
MRSSVLASCRLVALAVACAAASCSASSGDNPYGGGAAAAAATGGAGGGSAGGAAEAGTGGVGAAGMPESGPLIDVSVSDGSGGSDAEACSAQTASGEVWPLSMYIMMDQSGSMESTVDLAGKVTQWDAAKKGLAQFFDKPTSDGVGVGIQFFPLPIWPWGSMPTCTQQNPTCPAGKVCAGSDIGYYCHPECQTSATCSGSECVTGSGGSGGSTGYCHNNSCDPGVYAKPEVPIELLPGVKAAVNAAIAAHGPLTLTPTVPALTGAVQYASSYAKQHLDRKTVVVFVTDGMPTVCPYGKEIQALQQTQAAAKAGVAASPSIKTFVIGVVIAMNWAAVGNLNSIAAAGGTGQALIVQPNQDMGAQFTAALDKIKGTALGCEYKIPLTDAGKPDYDKMNVAFTIDNGQPETVYYVGDASKCDAQKGGWYYDTDPVQTAPTKIIMCPATCAQLQTPGHKSKIDILMGCKTQIMPPK